VVWWQTDFHVQEDEAVAQIIVAFEQETGKQVELVQPAQGETIQKAQAALAAGQPPDFLFGITAGLPAAQWAYEDRLVDLEGALNPVLDLFDADAIEVSTLLDGKTGRRGLYALPMGRHSNHLHVWNSLLQLAGFGLADIPRQWEPFWSFWCDQVQPAVRRALGRDDIWGVGLPMSPAASDTAEELLQFQLAYGAPWQGRRGAGGRALVAPARRRGGRRRGPHGRRLNRGGERLGRSGRRSSLSGRGLGWSDSCVGCSGGNLGRGGRRVGWTGIRLRPKMALAPGMAFHE
jgi:ABC-type glycerol-3-phosphate transport system substrate-binding protein